jgi:HlyD family secretion protein
MKKRLKLVLALSLLTASAATLSSCSSNKPADAAQAQIPTVKVISSQGLTVQGISGKVAANETVQIYTKLQGRIVSINVAEGSKVKKGDVLVQLETSSIEEQVNQAQAGLNAAQAKLADTLAGARQEDIRAAQSGVDAAKATIDQTDAALDLVMKAYNVAKNNYDNGDISKDDLDKATTTYKSAKAARDQALASTASAQAKLDSLKAGAASTVVDQLKAGVSSSQASLNLAKINLKDAAIISPIDGIVVKKFASVGEMAFSSMPSGASILELVSMDPAKVEVSVPGSLVNQLKEGSTMDVQVPSLPDKKLQGTVSFISPISDANNDTFPVKLAIQNSDNSLRAGTVVNVFFSGSGQRRVELPKSTIITKEGKSLVYKLDGDIVHAVTVQTEEKNQDWVYLKDGSPIKDSDKIVMNPSDKLADGMKVHVE